MLRSKEWVRQLTEELFQQARNTIDIVVEVLRVPEVESLALRF